MNTKSLYLILTMVISVISGSLVHAEEPIDQLATYNKKIDMLLAEGRFVDALPVAQKLVTLNTELYGQTHLDVGRSQFQLAEIYSALDQLRKADGPYKFALWIFEQKLPPAAPETERVVMRLIDGYTEQKLWQQVNILLLHWYDVTRQSLGPDAPQTIEAVKKLAAFYRETNREIEARNLERELVM